MRVDSSVGKSPWRRKWQPTPVFLPGESHGQRSWWASVLRVAKSQTQQTTYCSLSKCMYITLLHGEGNGSPLQCSCLQNPRDGGAWWAAVYGVAQSRPRLKPLSSSSSNITAITTVTSLCSKIKKIKYSK